MYNPNIIERRRAYGWHLYLLYLYYVLHILLFYAQIHVYCSIIHMRPSKWKKKTHKTCLAWNKN